MPRNCTVCIHPDRNSIDQALLAAEPYRHIAARTGTSTGSLQRHKHDHLRQSLTRALEVREREHGDSLLAQLEELQARTMDILSKAEADGDWRNALSAIGQAKGLLELRSQAEREATWDNEHAARRPATINISSLIITPHTGPLREGDELPRSDVVDVPVLAG